MADNPTGTSVTLVVQQGTTVPTRTPPSHLPHTGFELTAALLAGAALLAVGTTLHQLGRPINHLRRNS